MVASFLSFLQYLQFEKRYSPLTINSYSVDINQLSEYLLATYETEDLSSATYQMLRSWLLTLAGEGMKASSLSRKIACLKSFYKFLHRRGYISSNPTIRLKSPRLAKRLPIFLSEESTAKLASDLEFTSDFKGQRDKLIIEMLYGTGMRRAELIGLQDHNFNPYNNTLKVLGKGNKERILPINHTLCSLIKEYLTLKYAEMGRTCNYLLLTDKGERLYPEFVLRKVKQYLSQDGITTVDKKSPHVLRHTFATQLLNRGADLTSIKELLGHSSLAATQVYTHNSIEKLKQAFEKAHPKA